MLRQCINQSILTTSSSSIPNSKHSSSNSSCSEMQWNKNVNFSLSYHHFGSKVNHSQKIKRSLFAREIASLSQEKVIISRVKLQEGRAMCMSAISAIEDGRGFTVGSSQGFEQMIPPNANSRHGRCGAEVCKTLDFVWMKTLSDM